ncbi:MAG: hypothetical protein NC123_01845 [Butyrivibrio sp.]|nr:hypothetical protein [Acetatifactor muris]MCM1558281.1 hypothetical protein [Butyrivibrio sp.]
MGYSTDYELDSQLSTNTFVNNDYVAMSNAMIHTFMGSEDEEFDDKFMQSVEEDLRNLTEW